MTVTAANLTENSGINLGESTLLAKVQTRTQGDFTPLYNVSDEVITPMSLTVTAPLGTSFIELDWFLMVGSSTDRGGFIVTKDGVPLPDSVDGSNNPWSCLATLDRLSSHVTNLTQTVPVRIFDASPSIGVAVLYEVRARATGSSATVNVHLNYDGVGGGDNKEEGMSTGRATRWT